jgi:peptidoglycan hydrolase-like protein with peptidoglycan-binding domain
MESIDVSPPNPTDSLVPNTGQQSDTFPSNPLQLPNPDSNHSGSGKDPSLSDEAALNAATWFAEQQLDSFTSDEDFLDNMEQAFGNDWQSQQAEDLIQDLASGDAMPKVETLPASELKANGAFGEDTIYLSEEFLSNAKSEKVSSALLEEIGHYVDQELNSGDSPGDEGDIFQQLVQDEAISEGELVELKAEDDSGTIALDGEEISVEQASPDYPGYLLEYEPGEPLEDRPAVKQWQRQMKKEGYDIGEAGVDGLYGSDTEEATIEFQKDEEIKVDGIVGPNTWEAAFSTDQSSTTDYNTLTLESLHAVNISDEGGSQDEPKIVVDYSLKGDPLEYELYSEENGLKQGETHYFEKFENNTDVEVTEISEVSVSLFEKDAQGYRLIDSKTIASNILEDYNSVTLNSPNNGAKYILNYS